MRRNRSLRERVGRTKHLDGPLRRVLIQVSCDYTKSQLTKSTTKAIDRLIILRGNSISYYIAKTRGHANKVLRGKGLSSPPLSIPIWDHYFGICCPCL
jgi:hypothetical protein